MEHISDTLLHVKTNFIPSLFWIRFKYLIIWLTWFENSLVELNKCVIWFQISNLVAKHHIEGSVLDIRAHGCMSEELSKREGVLYHWWLFCSKRNHRWQTIWIRNSAHLTLVFANTVLAVGVLDSSKSSSSLTIGRNAKTSTLAMPFSGKWQTETKPIPMKWQPQKEKPNTKPIFILPKKTILNQL